MRKWITNCDAEQAEDYIERLKQGHQDRVIVIGEAKTDETHYANVVGLYDVLCVCCETRPGHQKVWNGDHWCVPCLDVAEQENAAMCRNMAY